MSDLSNSYFVMSKCRLQGTIMYIKRISGETTAHWTHSAKEALAFSDRDEAKKWCNLFREADQPTKLNDYYVIYSFSPND